MQVRPAGAADTTAILAILAESPEAGRWSPADWKPPRRCLVIEEEGRPIGWLLADCPTDDETEILALAVGPRRRRQGLGRALLGALVGSRRGRIHLEVRESNVAARALYHWAGFTTTGRRRQYYSDPPEDAVLMQLVCL